MDNRLQGKLVVCDWCGKKRYKELSRIRKHNFCNHEHRKLYLAIPRNIDMSKGWSHSREAIEKIGLASKGHKMTKGNLEKIKESNKKRVWTKEMREKLRNANLGKKLSEETKKKIREHGRFKHDNNQWKDMDASYQAKHMYVYRHKAKPVFCIDCNATSNEKIIQWSNKDHLYSRNLEDYEGRCIPCHRRYDYEHGFVEPEGKAKRFYL